MDSTEPGDRSSRPAPPTGGAAAALHAALVRESRDVIVISDPDGRVTWVSPSVERVAGHRPEDLVGRDGLDLVHPDDLPSFVDHLHWLAAHPDEPRTTEARVRHRDGSWLWSEVVGVNLLAEPSIGGFVGQFRDVSARRRAEAALRESERRFRALVQSSSDLVTVFDDRIVPVYVSPSHETHLGHPLSELTERARPDLVHPDDLEPFATVLAQVAEDAPGANRTTRVRFRHADGTWHQLEAVLTNLRHEPAVRGVVVNARDITERVLVEEELLRSERRFAALVRHSSDVVLVLDDALSLRYVSPAVASVLGHEVAAVERAGGLQVHPADRAEWRGQLERLTSDLDGHGTFEARVRHADGGWRWAEVDVTNLVSDPAVGGLVLHVRDVSERRRAEHELAHRALHDELTGLPNRALVTDRLERALGRCRRTGLRTALLFCDLDRFKLVNDSLGHRQGDALLAAVAQRLRGVVRSTDTVARLGGDEFVVLLEDLPADEVAIELAHKVLDRMGDPFRVDGREHYLSTSVGLASSDGHDAADALVRDADAAMYAAKAHGRNRLEVFDGAARRRLIERVELEHDLHHALQDAQLRLEWQPSFDVVSGRVVGIEALLRWDHPGRGLVLPGQFLEIAEETGLVVPIGARVVDLACAQARRWLDGIPGWSGPVWVNVSERQLAEPDFADLVLGAIEAHDLVPTSLGLEVTEAALVTDDDPSSTGRVALARLGAQGVRLAIDDFGTGYSSLLSLRDHNVDVLKLDRRFVAGIDTCSDDQAVSGAVIELGHRLGMEIVAEGVETTSQLDRLRALGCDAVCGFLLARPMDREALARLLRDPVDADASRR